MLANSFAAGAFHGALQQTAQDARLENGRFPSRNFLLECEVSSPRVQKYLDQLDTPSAGSDSFDLQAQLNRFHNRYLDSEVRVGVRSQPFDESALDCPETFRAGCHTKEFGGTGSEVLLVRVEELRFVAGTALWDYDSAKDLLSRVGDANRRGAAISNADRVSVAGLLDGWQDRVDARPLFAAFWDDAHDASDWARAGWANVLRDRMGLAHYDPALRGNIDIVMFQYPVAPIAVNAIGARLLVRPTVLDASLSEAFYTAEPFSGTGSAVDLEIRDEAAWQEVLHPPFRLGPAHIWGLDSITADLPSTLAQARQQHLVKTVVASTRDFADLCEEVDGDL